MRARAVWVVLLVLIFSTIHGYGQEQGTPTVHVVQRGENLYRISLQYGLTVAELARANSISNPDSIYVGQRLIIPQPGAVAPSGQSIVHIVQPGETLAAIAQLYGVSTDFLASENDIADPSSIYVGQMLTIPGGTGADQPVEQASEPPTEQPTAQPTPEPAESVEIAAAPGQSYDPTSTVIHVVARGESLFAISKEYGVEANAIINANQIADPSLIYAGQELVIPGVQPPQYAGALPDPIERLTVMPLVMVEGHTGRIDFATASAVTVTGQFLGMSLHDGSQNDGTLHTILFGVPVGTEAGVYPLTLNVESQDAQPVPFDINLQVTPGGFGRESINISANLLNTIDADVDQAEISMLQQLMAPFTPMRYFDGLMGIPAAAPMSSPFGGMRTYNGGAYQHVHTGTDFAAAAGSPIYAPAAGRVVYVDHLNVRGNATVIDHGWGVYTCYWHQTEQYVSVGDMVEKGQVIGTVGSTGRVTGAHLHWEIWVNDVPVDPMQWVSEPLGR